MIIGLTENLELVSLRGNEIKKQAFFRGWVCKLGENMKCLNQTDGDVKDSECNNVGNICQQELCWCGADLEIVKGVDESAIQKLKELYLTNIKTKEWNQKDKIIAMGWDEYLTNTLFHIDWTILKKCNYDCSYCPDTVHDNFSPAPTYQESIDYFNKHTLKIDFTKYENIRVTLTGGEPTIMRELDTLLEDLYEFSTPRIITNGTANTEKMIRWHERCEFVISMHPEYMTDYQCNKIIKFLEATPYKNIVNVKFYEDGVYYQRLVDLLKSPKYSGWAYVKLYPVIDKTKNSTKKFYTLKKVD